MPKIPSAHLKGNEAVSALVHRLGKIGILADKITSDYGEDLILQTHLKNNADSFNIRVQVKYVSLEKDSRGRMAFRFSIDHLRRWVEHSDPILLCLYDKAAGRFFVIDPKAKFSIWQLAISKLKSIKIEFADEDAVDDSRLKALIWSIRIQYYSAMIARLESRFLYASLTKEEAKRSNEFVKNEIGTIIFDFLRVVEVLKHGKFDKHFLTGVSNVTRNFSKKGYADLGLREAFMLSILARVDEVAEQGLPRNLMENSTELCGHFLRYTNPKKWKELSSYFSGKWHPFGIKKLQRRSKP